MASVSTPSVMSKSVKRCDVTQLWPDRSTASAPGITRMDSFQALTLRLCNVQPLGTVRLIASLHAVSHLLQHSHRKDTQATALSAHSVNKVPSGALLRKASAKSLFQAAYQRKLMRDHNITCHRKRHIQFSCCRLHRELLNHSLHILLQRLQRPSPCRRQDY